MKKNLPKNKKTKIIAAISAMLSLVLFVSCITVWQNKNKTKMTLTEPESSSEQSQIPSVTKNQTPESSTQANEDNNVDKTDESTSSTVTNTESSTKAASVQSIASKTESTTKATASKSKPAKTVKPNSTTEPEYYYEGNVKYCENGQHQWDEWVIDDGQKHYRCCTKCPEQENNENWEWKPEYHMGTKAEYMELFNLVNNARKERGLEPFKYKAEWQAGADQRAVDLTQKFAHVRPDGRLPYTAYTDHNFPCLASGECIAGGCGNASMAFNAWKNSEGHWAALMNETPQDVVIARCGAYWVFSFPL